MGSQAEDLSSQGCEVVEEAGHSTFRIIIVCFVQTYSDMLHSFTLGDSLMITFTLWSGDALLSN